MLEGLGARQGDFRAVFIISEGSGVTPDTVKKLREEKSEFVGAGIIDAECTLELFAVERSSISVGKAPIETVAGASAKLPI